MTTMRNLALASLALLAAATPAAARGIEPLFPYDTCTQFYPPDLHVEGEVMLAFEITDQGRTQDIRVITSSGNAELDRAAQRCVAGFLYRPTWAVPWHARVVWKIGPDGHPQSVTDVPHDCDGYRPKEAGLVFEGTTTLSFTVKVDGYVEDIKVAKPSGNAELDEAAVKCASRWHYRPQTVDGVPTAAAWQAAVVWKFP